MGCSNNRLVVIEGAVDLDLKRVETTGDGCGIGLEGVIPEQICFRYKGDKCDIMVGGSCEVFNQ